MACSWRAPKTLDIMIRTRPLIQPMLHPRYQISRRGRHDSATIDPEVSSLLERPSWSVRSLLPKASATDDAPPVTSKQLHHLFRLSALPPPETAEQEKKTMSTLSAQLHFVREVQSVDTTGVEPLRSIRDETPEAIKDSEITVDRLRHVLDMEEVQETGRIRRKKQRVSEDTIQAENWDVLAQASRKSGRYFVVETEVHPHKTKEADHDIDN